MAQQTKKEWIPTSACVFPPDAIPLGQIIADPTKPHEPLFSDLDLKIFIVEADIRSDTQNRYQTSLKRDTQLEARFDSGPGPSFLNAIALPLLPFIEFGFKYGRQAHDQYDFASINKRWFDPSDALARSVVLIPRVRDYFEDKRYRKPVFVVTGVMTCKDGNVMKEKSSNMVSGLPGYWGSTQLTQHESFGVSSSVVLGYKLCKVSCKSSVSAPIWKEFVKGAEW